MAYIGEIIEAYKQGNIEFFQRINNTNMLINVLNDACVSGNVDLLKFLVQHFQVDLNFVLKEACGSGHMEIVQFAIEKGATDFNIGLWKACLSGHVEIVKLMIQKGANNFNDGLFCSTLYGNDVISNLMIENGATVINVCLLNACTVGSLKLIESIFEKDVNYTLGDLNKCLERALILNHFEIVKLLIRKGATNYNNALKIACFKMNCEQEKIRLGRTDIIYEDEVEYIEMIKLMIEYGAKIKSCKELTSQIIMKTLNIGCNLKYFLHDKRSFPIINSHNNLNQHLRTILSHNNDSLQIPDDMIDYCIFPYVNYTV